MPRINWKNEQGNPVDPVLEWQLTQQFERTYGPLLDHEWPAGQPKRIEVFPPVNLARLPPRPLDEFTPVETQRYYLIEPPEE